MTEAIERAARALHAAFQAAHPTENPCPYDESEDRDVYCDAARAVIDSVLLDPIKEVVEAAARKFWHTNDMRAALRAAGLAITGRTE